MKTLAIVPDLNVFKDGKASSSTGSERLPGVNHQTVIN
jgi:hypothetical protein